MKRAYLQYWGRDTEAEIVCEPCWRIEGDIRNRWSFGRHTQFLGEDVPPGWACSCSRGGEQPYMVTLTFDRYHYHGQPSQEAMWPQRTEQTTRD